MWSIFGAAMAIAVVSLRGNAEAPATRPGQVGRYQLCFGKYEFKSLGKDNRAMIEGLFRLDTQTGEFSVYQLALEPMDDGKNFHLVPSWFGMCRPADADQQRPITHAPATSPDPK